MRNNRDTLDDIIDEAIVKGQRRKATGNILGAIGVIFFAGWILFLTYNAFSPESWPYLGLWTAFGASYLFRYVACTLNGANNFRSS